MKIIKVPQHEFQTLKSYGMLTPRQDIEAKVSKRYIIVGDSPDESLIVTCSQNMPISFRLDEVICDEKNHRVIEHYSNKTIYETDAYKVEHKKPILAQQPKSLI